MSSSSFGRTLKSLTFLDSLDRKIELHKTKLTAEQLEDLKKSSADLNRKSVGLNYAQALEKANQIEGTLDTYILKNAKDPKISDKAKKWTQLDGQVKELTELLKSFSDSTTKQKFATAIEEVREQVENFGKLASDKENEPFEKVRTLKAKMQYLQLPLNDLEKRLVYIGQMVNAETKGKLLEKAEAIRTNMHGFIDDFTLEAQKKISDGLSGLTREIIQIQAEAYQGLMKNQKQENSLLCNFGDVSCDFGMGHTLPVPPMRM